MPDSIAAVMRRYADWLDAPDSDDDVATAVELLHALAEAVHRDMPPCPGEVQ